MKKFLGYITLAVTSLIALGVGIIPSLNSINGNIDYSRSRTYVYKIGDRITTDSANNLDQNVFNSYNDDDKQEILDDVVDTFRDRLDIAQVSEYNIETDGYDTIKVTFKTATSLYDDVASYLNFSWSMMASTYGSETNIVLGDDAETVFSNISNTGLNYVTPATDYSEFVSTSESSDNDTRFFEPGSAYVEYRNGYPYVVVGLANPEGFKDLYEQARGDSGESTGEDTTVNGLSKTDVLRTNIGTGSEPDGPTDGTTDGTTEEETETPDENKIFVLNNWLSNLDLETLLENGGTSNLFANEIKEHVLFTIDATAITNVYWDYDANNTEEDPTYEEIYFGGYDLLDASDEASYYGTVVTDPTLAYQKANIWAGKLNATTYGYEINLTNEGGSYAYTETNDPQVEYLVENQKVTLSSLLIAGIVGTVIITLFMILNFGLPGLLGAISTLGILVATLATFNMFGIYFNIGAILGILTLLAISLFTTTALFKKIKNDIYLGKNFKKAYQDGGKKSFWYMLDSSIIGLILGIVAYLIPSTITLAFGTMLVVGSCLNVLINGIALRAISYLLYTSSFIANKPRLLALEPKLIPNLLNDEKPTYFDVYKTKQNKTSKKVYSIVGLILLVASIAGIATFQAIDGSLYPADSSSMTTMFYAQSLYQNPSDNIDNRITNNLLVYQEGLASLSTDSTLENKVLDVSSAEDIEVTNYYYEYKNEDATNRVYFFVVDLQTYISVENYSLTDTTYYYTVNNSSVISTNNLLEALSDIAYQSLNTDGTGELKNVETVDNNSAGLYTLIGVSISVGVACLYFAIRFGPSRALSALLMSSAGVVISIGIFTLIRVPASSAITFAALLLLAIFLLMFNSYFLAEKEVFNENKKELQANRELRYEQFEYAINIANENILTTGLLIGFGVMSLFFAAGVETMMCLLILVGIILFFMFIKVLYIPSEILFNKWFLTIRNSASAKVKGRKDGRRNLKDEGPTEAIFTGIND